MDLVPNCSLTFDEYWNKKFKGKNHEEILKEGFRYTDTDFKKFEMHWMNQIEAEEYLKYDTVINEVSD
ncbi:hypothetical protein Q0M92_14170, partial [Staphylococcus aureus]|nr:hypothetical protein [Staphylococcus aureus]